MSEAMDLRIMELFSPAVTHLKRPLKFLIGYMLKTVILKSIILSCLSYQARIADSTRRPGHLCSTGSMPPSHLTHLNHNENTVLLLATLKLCKSSFYRKQNNFLSSRNKKVKLSEFINLLKLALTALNCIIIGAQTGKNTNMFVFSSSKKQHSCIASLIRDNTQIHKHTKKISAVILIPNFQIKKQGCR